MLDNIIHPLLDLLNFWDYFKDQFTLQKNLTSADLILEKSEIFN